MSKIELSNAVYNEIMALPGNDGFYSNAITAILTHANKSLDYNDSGVQSGFSNFIMAAAYARTSVKTVFAVLIGTKIARLQVLQYTGSAPRNESIADTQRDLSVYLMLEAAFQEQYPLLYTEPIMLEPGRSLVEAIEKLTA